MDQIAALGSDIAAHARPTFGIYAKLHGPQASGYIQPTEYSYGPLPRQKLDVYETPNSSEKRPVLVFLFGGGLIQGDKRMPFPGVWGNVGNFFATKGYLTIIMNYRLVDIASPASPSNALFPSGGADVSLALSWLPTSPLSNLDLDRVFLMGNSAGAVHAGTYVYRDAISSLSHPISGPAPPDSVVQVKGLVVVGAPANFERQAEGRKPVTEGYYGGGNDVVRERCLVGLRERSKDETPALIVVAEFDPDDEIGEPTTQLFSAYGTSGVSVKPRTLFIPGHNHISTPLGLSLGGEEEEWGHQVIGWIETL